MNRFISNNERLLNYNTDNERISNILIKSYYLIPDIYIFIHNTIPPPQSEV
jgi:hypothetical protein